MQKTILTKAVAVALATLGASAAFAQTSFTIYGNIDGALDSVHKGQGNISGTMFQTLPTLVGAGLIPGLPAGATATATAAKLSAGFNGAYANKSTITRVSPSISSQNALGFKGTEDMGNGYKAGFVLEGQFSTDTGAQSGQDNRMWGRQAFVSLTTPVGEVRLGRQYAPMFYSFALTSVESIGAADIMASGLVVNNLQVRQDNQISYWLKQGDLTAALSYSPNAGVDSDISVSRGQAAGAANGQIIGGATAGNETAGSGGRGQSIGLFVNYNIDPGWLTNFGYHTNKFGTAKLKESNLGITLASLDKYTAYSVGMKYTLPSAGTQLAGIFHYAKFTNDAGSIEGPKIETLALGVKQPIDQFSVGAEFAYGKFMNFTKGKDTAVMLAGDYNFSKRTKVYIRAGYMKDSRGNLADTDATATLGLRMAGGPAPLLFGLGSTELPFFAGGGMNIDATTRVVGVGIRHQF
jgi:predicted porin